MGLFHNSFLTCLQHVAPKCRYLCRSLLSVYFVLSLLFMGLFCRSLLSVFLLVFIGLFCFGVSFVYRSLL